MLSFEMFPLYIPYDHFVYVRTAYVAHPLEFFQYCSMCILLVTLGWLEEDTATGSQISALSLLFFVTIWMKKQHHYALREELISLFARGALNHTEVYRTCPCFQTQRQPKLNYCFMDPQSTSKKQLLNLNFWKYADLEGSGEVTQNRFLESGKAVPEG